MVGTAGTTTVPAHTLYEIVRKLADGAEVRLETEGGEQMLLTSGRSRFHLACLSPDSFPDLKSGAFSHSFSLPAATLRELIERTQFAISNEETRYYLNGIYVHTLEVNKQPVLRAVATDGHRMARAETDAPSGTQRHAGDHHSEKDRRRNPEAARWRRGRCRDRNLRHQDPLHARRRGAAVEAHRGHLPRLRPGDAQEQRQAAERRPRLFATAVDRVSTIASDRGGKAVKLAVKDGNLELCVTNPDHGTATEEVAVEFEPESFEIGFNARYLLDIIGQIRSDNAVFLFNDAGSPTLVKEDGEAKALYVLMPMRV